MPAAGPASLLLLLIGGAAARYEPIAFPSKCATGSYFDVSALACLTCPPTQTADSYGTSCVCAAGRVLQGDTCVWCNATGLAPSADGTACMECTPNNVTGGTCSADATLGYDAVTKQCTCPAGEVLQDRDQFGGLLETKRCRPCPGGTFKQSLTSCVACPDANMVAAPPATGTTVSTGCVCNTTSYRAISHPSGWWGREVSCVPTAQYNQLLNFDNPNAFRVTYRQVRIVPAQR
jgi:hypothetical protein